MNSLKACLLVAMCSLGLGIFAGCGSMTDSGRIVGRWKFSDTPSEWVFKADGTFVWDQIVGDVNGTYTFESGRLKIETPGLMYGKNVWDYAYEFSGDTLLVSDGKGTGIPKVMLTREP